MPDSPCPGELVREPCFTLSQYTNGEYAQHTSNTSEIVLQFQPGHHVSLSGNNTLGSWLVSFTMITVNSENSTEIDYDSYRHQYLITNVQNVRISGIDFVHCGLQIESVVNFTIEKSNFSQVSDYDALQIRSSSDIIKWCNFSNNTNLPLHAFMLTMLQQRYTTVHLSTISMEGGIPVEEVC